MICHLYKNRCKAGKALAQKLHKYKGRDDVILLALPRGGVPVAYEVAKALTLPLDVWIVRKIGIPGYEECAMGAISGNNVRLIDQDVKQTMHVSDCTMKHIIARELEELIRRNKLYRQGRPNPDFTGKTVILIDDGLATGFTMQAAIHAIYHQNASKIIVAVPLGSREAVKEISAMVDEVICLEQPSPFFSVGLWYENFRQTSDEEVGSFIRNQPWLENNAYNTSPL